MYRRILVPIDGSPLSERALRFAMPIAKQHGARVTLLHVAPPMRAMTAGGGAPVRDSALDDDHAAADRRAVARIAKRVQRESTVPVDVAYAAGRPAAEITAFASREGIDLVVMCTHGRGGFERLWLGSVADALLRHLSVPTLLVPGARGAAMPAQGEPLFPRALVPLDGSPRAEGALDALLVLVGSDPLALTLFSAVHPLHTMSAKSFPSPAEQELCAAYLEPLASRHRRERRTIEVETAVSANVGRAIIEHAKKHDASVIALATQGLGGVDRFLIGSVADKLLRTAPMPVLVIPSPTDRPVEGP